MAPPQTHRFSENGQRIRRARHLTGWSQENFAPRVGVTRRQMIKLENGEHRPRAAVRDRIVELTGTEEQIESVDDEDEDALMRALIARVRIPSSELSTEATLRVIYPDADGSTVQRLRMSGLKDLARSFAIEETL